jgi:hypothetical protein
MLEKLERPDTNVLDGEMYLAGGTGGHCHHVAGPFKGATVCTNHRRHEGELK